ncbi:uncharacterized protein METZ01_LOCUS348966, partial [marine metagenome]
LTIQQLIPEFSIKRFIVATLPGNTSSPISLNMLFYSLK